MLFIFIVYPVSETAEVDLELVFLPQPPKCWIVVVTLHTHPYLFIFIFYF